jgi:hypothetical protein
MNQNGNIVFKETKKANRGSKWKFDLSKWLF